MTIAIYIRVSTLEQVKEGYSISAQKERLIAFCTAQGWDDYKFYVDEGVSGKDTNRPQLQKLLKDIDQGKISMLLVYRLDRFTRSVLDLHKMLEQLDKHNCAFKSATEPYDTTTAMGRMFITIVAAMAQWEIENSSERIKMALEEKVSEGERVGNVPFGFDLSADEKLVKNKKAPVVLDMIEKAKSGMSANAIVDFLNKTNSDRTWRAISVLRILKNPALYGASRWNDKVYENTHEGLISKEEYMKLQQILDDRTIHKRREVQSVYVFQGVLCCPNCNRPLSVNRYLRNRKSDGSSYQIILYRCQHCEKDKTFNKNISEERFIEALYQYMKDVKVEHIEEVEIDEQHSMYEKQLKQIEKKREEYQKAWAADLIDDEEFMKLMADTRDIYEDLKKKVQEQRKAPARIDKETLKQVVLTFNQNFKKLTKGEKKAFISMFVRKIKFKLVPQPPKDPRKSKTGKDLVVITDVIFY